MALPIEPRLPSGLGAGDDVSFLADCKIVRFGTFERDGEEFLALQYQAASGVVGLELFGFSELGLWRCFPQPSGGLVRHSG